MTLSIVPIVAALIGLVLYFLPTNTKVIEVGRILFFAGILAALLVGAHSITIK